MTTVFPSSPDRALSVRQPWAEAIIGHGKTIENRRWDTGWRGSLLIHAAKATPTPDNELLAAALAGQPVDGSVRGAVIGVAELVGVCQPWCCRCGSRWAEPGAHHWRLTDAHRLPTPIPCPGSLGLWQVPSWLQAAVKEAR